MSELFTPTPWHVEDADDQNVLDGILVRQSSADWLRVDGQAELFGPLQNGSPAVPGDRVCVAVSQQGTLYVVWPGGAGATPPDPTGGDKTYVHTQGAPATSWVVTHNLNKYPAVDVVDTGNSAVIPSVQYTDINTVTLTFGSPTSGKAFVN